MNCCNTYVDIMAQNNHSIFRIRIRISSICPTNGEISFFINSYTDLIKAAIRNFTFVLILVAPVGENSGYEHRRLLS